MKDLISRQAAIDALAEELYHNEEDYRTAVKAIGGLPSAQPNVYVSTKEADYISRSQALNAIHVGGDLEGAWINVAKLPSAQPQRKRGQWIPVDSFSAFGGDEAIWMAHGNHVAFYYCSECKEQAYAGEDGESLLTDFCPSCGADMRGEGDE